MSRAIAMKIVASRSDFKLRGLCGWTSLERGRGNDFNTVCMDDVACAYQKLDWNPKLAGVTMLQGHSPKNSS